MNEEVNKIESSEEYKEYLKNRKSSNKSIGKTLFLDDIIIDCEKRHYSPRVYFEEMGISSYDNDKTKAIKCIEFAVKTLDDKKNELKTKIEEISSYNEENFEAEFYICDNGGDCGFAASPDIGEIYIKMYEKKYETFDEYKNRIYTEKQNLKKNREEKILNCKQNIELYKKRLEELEKEDET